MLKFLGFKLWKQTSNQFIVSFASTMRIWAEFIKQVFIWSPKLNGQRTKMSSVIKVKSSQKSKFIYSLNLKLNLKKG